MMPTRKARTKIQMGKRDKRRNELSEASDPILEIITNDKNYRIIDGVENVGSIGELARKYLQRLNRNKPENHSITHFTNVPADDKNFLDNYTTIRNNEGEIICLVALKIYIDTDVMNKNITLDHNFVELLEENRPLLHIAAKKGRIVAVKYLHSEQVNMDEKDSRGLTPFMEAAKNNQIEVMKFLKEECAVDIESQNHYGNRALHRAARNDQVDAVKLLLHYKANVNATNKNKLTPLHWAATNGSPEPIRVLLDANADIDAKDNEGEKTPLMRAIVAGHYNAVKELLSNSPDLSITSKNGFIALFWAVSKNREVSKNNVEIVKLLLLAYQEYHNGKPSNANKKNEHVDAALDIASSLRLQEMQDLLLEHGADPERIVHKEKYSVCDLVRFEDTIFLINRSNIADCTNKNGQTPLHLASMTGWKEGIDWLINDANADVNSLGDIGSTPVHLAVANSQRLDIIKLLIDEYQADFKLTDINNDQNLLHLSAIQGRDDIFEYIMQKGENINNTDALGNTPLMYAVENDCEQIVDLLMRAPNINVKKINKNKEDALIIAAKKGNYKISNRITSTYKYSIISSISS